VLLLVLAPLLVALVLLLLRRTRRRVEPMLARLPAARWERTNEVIRDPFTNRTVRVWVDPADGSRHYVPDRLREKRASRSKDLG
jgi:hypothetical protein